MQTDIYFTIMKKFTHAWLAFMAIKRLEYADIPEIYDVHMVQKHAKSLVRWFKEYRDFVIEGSWYPDSIICDTGNSHGVKYTPGDLKKKKAFKPLPEHMEVYNFMKENSKMYGKEFIIEGGNVCDRCEAMAHTLVDNFKIQYNSEKGNPIAPTNTHMALRFFMMSHYIADTHMPLHCDKRPFSGGHTIHAYIEDLWDSMIKQSYEIDTKNLRFYYDPKGYPLATKKMNEVMKEVEEKVINRPFQYDWGRSDYSTWDYMSAVSEYSYLLSWYMIPDVKTNDEVKELTREQFRESEGFKNLDKYSCMIFADAIDSIARAWLHAWIRYREWGPDKNSVLKKETTKKTETE